MAFKQFKLTLLANTPTRLSDVYGDGVGIALARNDIPYRQIILTDDPEDPTAAIYIGASNLVTNTNFAFYLLVVEIAGTAAATSPVILGPFETGPMKLSDFWAFSTAAQALYIGGIPY